MRLNKVQPSKQLGVPAANWSVVLINLQMPGIPDALGCNTYLSVWSVLAVFVPSLPHPLPSTVDQ